MKEEVTLGMNRTGMAVHPVESKRITEELDAQPLPTVPLGAFPKARVTASRDAGPLGSMPPPPTLKGMAKAALAALKGDKPSLLLDKLGERLAFERTGSRLYEAILAKYDAQGSWDGGPDREALERIHDEEILHMGLVERALLRLGADPTVMTPSADVNGTMSGGLLQVAADPRCSLRQVLLTALTAELVDNEGWDLLVDLCSALGQEELVEEFRAAQVAEERHLSEVRRWVADGVLREAKHDLPAEDRPAAP